MVKASEMYAEVKEAVDKGMLTDMEACRDYELLLDLYNAININRLRLTFDEMERDL